MNIRLVAYGIARDILKTSTMDFAVSDPTSIGALKQELVQRYPAFEQLKSLRFAVYEEYQPDDYLLQSNDEVVIIPPVSGG